MLPFAEQGGLTRKVRFTLSVIAQRGSVVIAKTDDVIHLVELHAGRLLKTLAHSEANHQTIMLPNMPATYILQHPAITGWLKLVNTIHW